MRQKIISKGISAEKVILLPDWADPIYFSLPDRQSALEIRKKLGLEDHLIVAHTGNMGVKQGLDIVIEAAELLREKKGIVFLLVGDGADRPRLEEKAQSLSLPCLKFIPLLSKEEYIGLLSAIDICLVTQKKEVGDIVFPSKVMTYLSAAKPVICAVNNNSEVAKVIMEANAGIVVPAEDSKAMAEAVETLSKDEQLRQRLGQEGRAYALGRWQKQKVLEEMEKTIADLLKK
ncbi:glycosyltransferase [Methylacidiphilum caldifontis]|uniref:glycosyltransferase n=1 Tax=Methylacidiphilum caldifontis TaxID=2795386 RepID=UPI001F5D82FC|nr:glycosyltransferase [Methylacidiphilum caldifontis]